MQIVHGPILFPLDLALGLVFAVGLLNNLSAAVVSGIVVDFASEERRLFFHSVFRYFLRGPSSICFVLGDLQVHCFGKTILLVQLFNTAEAARTVIFLQLLFQLLQEDRFLVVGDFEEGKEPEGLCEGIFEAGGFGRVGVGGVGEIKHDLEAIVLDCLPLLSVVVHNLVESGLVVNGSLGVIFIVLGQLPHLLLSLLVVDLELLILLLEGHLGQPPLEVAVLS